MLGDGSTQGSPVSSKVIARRQPRIGTTVRSQSSGRAKRGAPHGIPAHAQARELADGQAVPHRNRAQPHERLATLGSTVPPSMATPPSGFGRSRTTTATPARSRLHRQHHRPDVRVVAAADVLEIDDQHVDPRQIRRRRRQRLERLAVEADDRDPRAAIVVVVDADHVLRLAAHAVLGPVEPHRPHPDFNEAIDDVGQVGRDARRMTEDPHPPPPEEVQPLAAEDVETALDVHPFTLHHALPGNLYRRLRLNRRSASIAAPPRSPHT